jgi:hypothetical protein
MIAVNAVEWCINKESAARQRSEADRIRKSLHDETGCNHRDPDIAGPQPVSIRGHITIRGRVRHRHSSRSEWKAHCRRPGSYHRVIREGAGRDDGKRRHFHCPVARARVYTVSANAARFAPVSRKIEVRQARATADFQLDTIASSPVQVVVTGVPNDVELTAPDPSQRVMVRDVFTEDPRVGLSRPDGDAAPASLLERSHSEQVVLEKEFSAPMCGSRWAGLPPRQHSPRSIPMYRFGAER